MHINYHDKLKKFEEANKAYYSNNDPIMTDAEYDQLAKELEKDGEFSYSGNIDFNHGLNNFMGTLKKAHTYQDIIDFNSELTIGKCEYSWKIDGNSIVIKYDSNGNCIWASTRGDGENGKDMMYIFKNHKINNIFEKDIIIKYEATVLWEDMTDDYASPRSFITAILSSKKVPDEYMNILRLVPLEYKLNDENDGNIDRDKMNRMHVNKRKFTCISFNKIDKLSKETFEEILINSQQERKNLPYQIDGIVFYLINNNQQWNRNFPLYSIALKLPSQSVETTVINLEYTYSNNNQVTPVIEFKPITINGHVYSKCSLSSAKRLKSLMPIGPNTKIFATLVNDVLMYVEKMNCNENNNITNIFNLPSYCKYCNSELSVSNLIYCYNAECNNIKLGQMVEFSDRLGLKNFGRSFFESLYDEGKGIKDLLSLIKFNILYQQKNEKAIKYVENNKFTGLTSKRLTEFLNKLHETLKDINIKKLLHSFAINGIGKSNIDKVSENHELLTLVQHIINMGSYESDIKGWTDINKNIFINGIILNKEVYLLIDNQYKIKEDKKADSTDKETICFSGKLIKDKKEIISIINNNTKYIISDTFSSKVDILVTDEEATNKVISAKKLGKRIYSSVEFYNMII